MATTVAAPAATIVQGVGGAQGEERLLRSTPGFFFLTLLSQQ
jgi:hypothetical protein